MSSRYVVTYALFVGAIGLVDVAGAASLTDTFAFRSLCGPVLAWLMALFLPAETIQSRLIQLAEAGGGKGG